MFLEPILITLAFIILLIASYTDIKTREVPDWLNYALIFSALGIRAIFSINQGYQVILAGLLGFTACFVIANVFYFTKQWGGGDSKLLMGIGAIIGISYPLTRQSGNLFFFLLLLLIVGAIYGLIWMIVLAIKHYQIFWPQFNLKIRDNKTTHYTLILTSLLFLILTFFVHFLWPLVIIPLFFFYLFLFILIIEQNFFYKEISPKNLTEGDWLAEEVIQNNFSIMKPKTLEKSDIAKLQLFFKQHKLKTVLIKEGIPFVPSFLIAYVLLVIFSKLIPLINIFTR